MWFPIWGAQVEWEDALKILLEFSRKMELFYSTTYLNCYYESIYDLGDYDLFGSHNGKGRIKKKKKNWRDFFF